MAAMGIPTTRALAVVSTGQTLYRHAAHPGAILTRVASSHIRVGTFQLFASRQDREGLRMLADHAIERHCPEAAETKSPYLALLASVIRAQAHLIARWKSVGFIHGVMNTDNCTLSGETLDYGPCAFMDTYSKDKVFNSIDYYGRYAFDNQEGMAEWNLSGLAGCLVPLIHADRGQAIALAQETLSSFQGLFQSAMDRQTCLKLGLPQGDVQAPVLYAELLTTMEANQLDFTATFSDLSQGERPHEALHSWRASWCSRLQQVGLTEAQAQAQMLAVNPRYIPRNHLIEQVIRAAEEDEDFGPLHQLADVLLHPFQQQPGLDRFEAVPRPEQVVCQTFCGT